MKGQTDADQIKEAELRGGKREPSDPSVMYMPPSKGPFMCGRCEYFRKPHTCIKVEGHIEEAGCCNLFDPIESH
jgi:hypothetical protein